jgi:hypothetical protein
MNYEQAVNALGERILALIPKHPEILTITGPFQLFEIPGFKCDD